MTTPDLVHIPAAHFPDSEIMIRRHDPTQTAFVVFADGNTVTATMIVDWSKLVDAIRQLEASPNDR